MGMPRLKYVVIAVVLAGATAAVAWQAPPSEALPQVQTGFPKSLLPPPPTPVDPAVAAAPPEQVAPVVYVLLLGHARDATIGQGVQVSGRRLETLLQQALPTDGELVLKCVGFPKNGQGPDAADGQPLSYVTIDNAIAEIGPKVREGIDTVACFMLAHGSFDGNRYTPDYEYGHYFGMQQGASYPRSTLVERLKATKPKLTVLLSDSCNVRSDLPSFAPAVPAAPPGAVAALESLRTLLLKHTGVVSINASSPGQFSFYSPTQGGFFMQAFDETLQYCRDDVSWQEFFTLTTAETAKVFHAGFPNGCPYAWDAVNRRVLTLNPNDPRTQKVLQPFASRPLTGVVQDGVHIEGGAPRMCPCIGPMPEAVTQ